MKIIRRAALMVVIAVIAVACRPVSSFAGLARMGCEVAGRPRFRRRGVAGGPTPISITPITEAEFVAAVEVLKARVPTMSQP